MNTTITYTNPITLSHHGSYKYLNKQMLRTRDWIEKHIEIICASFTLRPAIEIRFRPLPRRRKAGSGGRGKIELDVSQGLRSIVETLLHELTHEEQYFEGRLVDFNRKTATWKGQEMRVYWPGANAKAQKKYMDLPWEIEARERAAKHILEVEQWTGPIPNDVV